MFFQAYNYMILLKGNFFLSKHRQSSGIWPPISYEYPYEPCQPGGKPPRVRADPVLTMRNRREKGGLLPPTDMAFPIVPARHGKKPPENPKKDLTPMNI